MPDASSRTEPPVELARESQFRGGTWARDRGLVLAAWRDALDRADSMILDLETTGSAIATRSRRSR